MIEASPQAYQDEQALRTLSIFTYIWAALCLTGVVLGTGWLIAGQALSNVDKGAWGTDPDMPVDDMMNGTLMSRFGVALIVGMSALAILHFVAARSLRRKKNPVVIYISAAIACLSVPLGTTLGIFTFIVMTRPGVKALFANAGFR